MKNVLIVDDSRTSRRVLRDILERAGYTIVGEAVNGQEGFDEYMKLKPDVVTMDITMPVMDGIEAAKKIQEMIDKNEMYDSIKIIFISAHANLDLSGTISGIKCAVDYYAKPITADKYKHLLDKYYYNKQ